jgi:hypothetical protein
MERLLPTEAAEPAVPDAAGAKAVRVGAYLVLAVLLAGGAWVRFNREIASVAPTLAAPAASAAEDWAQAGREQGLVEVGLVPVSATAEAVAAMGLPAADAAALTEAVQRRRLRLVRLPLFDTTPTLPGEGNGRDITVTAAGYSRLLHLTRLPVTVTLPIGPVGAVAFSNAGGDAVGIGAITLSGPVRLPDLPAGAVMRVGVVSQ